MQKKKINNKQIKCSEILYLLSFQVDLLVLCSMYSNGKYIQFGGIRTFWLKNMGSKKQARTLSQFIKNLNK